MSKKELYNNLMINLENNNEFYKFYHAITSEQTVEFNGTNPCLLYGVPISVSTGNTFPILINDIGYKKDGKLYQILTNQEVVVIHEGMNERKDNQIFAAANITAASSNDLKDFVSLMTQRKNKNIKSYEYIYVKKPVK